MQLPAVLQGFFFFLPSSTLKRRNRSASWLQCGSHSAGSLWALWSGWVWAELDHSPAPGDFPFHFVHINREAEAGQKRESEGERKGRRRGGESNKGQEKGTEGKGGGERRAQSGGVCPRRMNEIFISDTEDTRLLSHIFSSLWFYHSLLLPLTPAGFSSLYSIPFSVFSFLSLSSLYCVSLPLPPFPPSLSFSFSILSELSPLVEVRELFLSICPIFLFLTPSLWRKQEIANKITSPCFL